MDCAVSADHRVRLKESEKRKKYLELVKELKDLEHEGDGNANCNWCARNNLQMTGKGIRILGNKRKSEDHPNRSIIKINQNTKKSPGNLKRLAVTQTPMGTIS